MPRVNVTIAVLAAALFCLAGALSGQIPLNERVLVVYNANGSDSLAVAKYYMAQRKIPESARCKISVSSPDVITQDEYNARVKGPVRKCLDAAGKQKILYIVFSYQTPYTMTISSELFSLDQYVADIWDEYSPSRPGREAGNQPYFSDAQSQGNAYEEFVPLAAYREQPGAKTIYSVWRLDAANAGLAKGLVDKALFAETHGLSGKGCFDLQFGPIDRMGDYDSGAGDWDVHQAGELTMRAGFPVVEDEQTTEFGTPPSALRCDNAAFYAGWYSLGHYNDAFTWAPGALGFHMDSASASSPRDGVNWAANAVLKGITITSGAVSEPYLEGLAHPDQIFLYLFEGACVGDAVVRSTRWLKWMIINIGDPLYRPFPRGVGPFQLPARAENLLAVVPQMLVGGSPSVSIIGLSAPAPQGGTTLSLSTDRPDYVILPKTITIPEKASMAKIPLATRAVADRIAVRVTMTVGAVSRSNTLLLHPMMANLRLSAARVTGATPVTGTITLYQGAPAEGITVALSSANPELASVPSEVKVPGGANSVTFRISTRAVPAEASSVITATAAGAVRSATLTVGP